MIPYLRSEVFNSHVDHAIIQETVLALPATQFYIQLITKLKFPTHTPSSLSWQIFYMAAILLHFITGCKPDYLRCGIFAL